MQLIVLGMHRSGTSSVTRLLNLAGAYFGPEGIATDANEENPRGFWERRDVRAICDALLQGGGFDWWQIADLDLDRIPASVVEEQLEAFREVVREMDEHRPWVLKEPRLSLLLPILRPALEAPIVIHVTRAPLEIAESLAARNEFPIHAGLALWEAYTLRALAASSEDPRVLVSYGELLADPVGTTARLLDGLRRLGVQDLRALTETEITAFISPTLHRQHEVAGQRPGHLNAMQASLAETLDEGHLPRGDEIPNLSPGADAALRWLEQMLGAIEAHDERLRRLERQRERTSILHERSLEAQDTAHRAAEGALRSEAKKRAAVEGHAISALDDATRRVRAAQTSGAVRVGVRLSKLRERLQRTRTGGADAALTSALQHIDEARSRLTETLVASLPAAGPGVPEPPPIETLRQKRATHRAAGGRAKVAVLAWDLGHNPLGRAHLLADLLRDDYDVELWGSQFARYGTDLWAPMRHTSIPVRRFPGATFPEFLDTLEDAARRIDADAIYVSKPRLPALELGILAKELWNRPLLVDIDDFEPSFFGEESPLELDELLQRADDDDLTLPFGRLWTRACESVVRSADQITVSNLELEARYGGIVIPHARDETVFDPAAYDRAAARGRLGLRADERLLLFGGTPRAHKGIVDLLTALDQLGDDQLRLGVFRSRELEELQADIGPLARWLLPLPRHGLDELPELLAATDLSCALQVPGHPVSRYQMPAKVTDAMAMGVPCLVTPVPPLQPLVDKDVLEVFDGDRPLAERLREVFAAPEETADRAQRAREVFLESYSYRAVRPVASAAIAQLLDEPPETAPALRSLVTITRHVFRPNAVAAARLRRPLPAGTTYDLVVFWKQNDTGIYGRRQDMFLKYLERSGRLGTIVHFDQPMSAEALLLAGRRSVRNLDQSRLVVEQTVGRLTHRSDRGPLRQRTYVYGGGRLARSLHLRSQAQYATYVESVLAREGIGGRPLLCWIYPTNELLPEVIDRIAPDVVVADVVDDNRTWHAPGTPRYQQLDRNYRDLLDRSDIVLANCQPVAESMRAFAPHVDVVPNVCELPDTIARGPRPPELADIRGPIIGYAGNLSDRIDLPLLRDLARARRAWTFVLLGSAHLDRSALALAEEPNVRVLGTRRYAEAQAIIQHFDVGLIPHVDNEMTRSMNPLKAFVYAALGVPIVSTPVANLDEMADFITIAHGVDGFAAAIDALVSSPPPPPTREALLPHSWDERVERVLRLIDDHTEARSPSAALG